LTIPIILVIIKVLFRITLFNLFLAKIREIDFLNFREIKKLVILSG